MVLAIPPTKWQNEAGMKIHSLTIKHFKKFADKTITFDDGLNVIIGQNEQGKSTIADALLLSLFGNPTIHSEKFKQKYTNWQSPGNIAISFEFEDGSENSGNNVGETVLVEKDFTANKFSAKDSKGGVLSDNYKAWAPSFLDTLGIHSPELYKSTAFFSNMDLTKVHEVASLGEAIKQAIVGIGGVKLKEAMKKLDTTLTELNKGLVAASKTPGTIKYLKTQLQEKELELSKVRSDVEHLKTAIEQKKSSGSKETEIQSQIKTLEEQLKNYDELKAAEKEVAALTEKSAALERDIQETKRIQAELLSKQKEVEAYSRFVKVDLDKFEEQLAAIKLERDQTEQLLNDAGEVDTEKPKFGLPNIALVVGGLVIGVLIGILVNIVVGIVIAVAGVVCGMAYFGLQWSGYTIKLGKAQLVANQNQRKVKAKFDELDSLEVGMLEKIGVSSVEEFAAGRAKYESVRLGVKELNESLGSYLAGRTLTDMEQEQLKLFTKKKEIESTKLTDKVRAAKMNENEYYRKRSDLDMLRLDLRDITAAQGASSARVEDAEVSVDDVSRLEEEIAGMREELAYFERKARVLALAKSGIEAARDEMVGSSKEFIENGVEKGLSVVTNGRYSDVRVDSDLGLQVFSSEKNDWIVPDETLSRGTIDQVYLCFRLALLEVVAEGKPIPLVLDDPFLTFDEERLASTQKLLADWATRHQIFLFTTRPEYKAWGKVIEI